VIFPLNSRQTPRLPPPPRRPQNKSSFWLGALHFPGPRDGALDRAFHKGLLGQEYRCAAIDPDPAKAAHLKRWGRAYWEAVNPFTMGGGYVNFMMGDEGDARISATYGGNFERLTTVKRKYDPNNLFRVNQNIRPTKGP